MPKDHVSDWFGEDFSKLHPLIQQLHQQGGQLLGDVELAYGKSFFARLIGKRVAKKLGLPEGEGQYSLKVQISHAEEFMEWRRIFGDSHVMVSHFYPEGDSTAGYWEERTGKIRMRLGVDIVDQGWHWRLKSVFLGKLPLPIFIFLKSKAYKAVEDGKYRFVVSFSLPLVGQFLSYGGLLALSVK